MRLPVFSNGDDDSLARIVGGIVPPEADPRYKTLKVEIDEELSYEREGKYFVEVNKIRLWEKEFMLVESIS